MIYIISTNNFTYSNNLIDIKMESYILYHKKYTGIIMATIGKDKHTSDQSVLEVCNVFSQHVTVL